jgi:DHA1 family bicyclomycin/chloramphenicol resistance-like MFS transporter
MINPIHKKPSVLSLIILISFPSASGVLMSPTLPDISRAFAISIDDTQWIILLFIIGYALGQIIYAPIANRFGRKPAIYTGIVIYFIGNAICFMGIDYHLYSLLLIGRLLMALGSAVGMVISFTMINDSYAPQESRSIIGYTVLAYAFMPALGIFIGGWVTHFFSWVACFDVYVIFGLIVLALSFTLPETLKPSEKSPINITHVLSRFKAGFSSRQLVLFSCIYGLMASYIYIIASSAPFIAIDTIGLSAAHYGTLILIPYFGQFAGGTFAGKLSHRFKPYAMMSIGYGATIFGSLLMFILFLCHWINVYTLIIPMISIMFGLPIVYSATTMMALVNFKDKATGSAVMSFITMSIAFLASCLLLVIHNQHAITMPILFLIVTGLAITVFWDAKRRFKDH